MSFFCGLMWQHRLLSFTDSHCGRIIVQDVKVTSVSSEICVCVLCRHCLVNSCTQPAQLVSCNYFVSAIATRCLGAPVPANGLRHVRSNTAT